MEVVSRSKRIPWAIGTAAILAGLCTVLTLDEWRFPDSLPLKSTRAATVPLFNAWTIGWNATRLENGLTDYWDAPIFAPAEGAFAFSEPQPATMLVAPIVWLTGSIFTGYKAWLFLSLFLNGFITALLLWRMNYPRHLQLSAAVAITLLPIVHGSIDVLQLVPVWGILWVWSCLFKVSNAPTHASAFETGLALATCFAVCVHSALFLSLLLPFAGLVFIGRLSDREFSKAVLISGVVAAAAIAPIVLPMRSYLQDQQFSRKEQLVRKLSAAPREYLAAPPGSLLHIFRSDVPAWRRLCPGWCRIALGFCGVISGLRSGRCRRWTLFLLVTAVAAFLLSLGPGLQVMSWQPWETLCSLIPGVKHVRNVFRFAWFVQLAIVLLAVEGLTGLAELRKREWVQNYSRTSFLAFVLAPVLLFSFEFWPTPGTRAGTPDVSRNADWIAFVRANASVEESIACLPFASGRSYRDYDVTTRWMCYGIEHGVPMVNGYSGYFPKEYTSLRRLVNEKFPSADVLLEFARRGVGHVIVARRYCGPDVMLSLTNDKLSVSLVFEDDVGVDVYRLARNGNVSSNPRPDLP